MEEDSDKHQEGKVSLRTGLSVIIGIGAFVAVGQGMSAGTSPKAIAAQYEGVRPSGCSGLIRHDTGVVYAPDGNKYVALCPESSSSPPRSVLARLTS
ncbi:MAG: hypothetical protein WDN67_04290 [Candidatus Moraniibacteriota bacterium]